ncbi:hypothetical protein [Bradyrhizobium semiaridum]|nr:hypothetical protein [Bradyrhizobium semiaridum]
MALDIVPVEAGAADRHQGGAIILPVRGTGGALHRRHMAVHAVVE